MRTSHLIFQDHQLMLVNGIKIASPETHSELHMYVHEGRELALPFVSSRPPLVVPSHAADAPDVRFLALLSLIATRNHLWMMEECNEQEKVLLFIDSLDPVNTGACGFYLGPPGHDTRLPYARRASAREQSTYGLVALGPGESLLVQSTGGRRTKLRLGVEGRFSHEPCNRMDHLLLEA
jgi:hypothetical protein